LLQAAAAAVVLTGARPMHLLEATEAEQPACQADREIYAAVIPVGKVVHHRQAAPRATGAAIAILQRALLVLEAIAIQAVAAALPVLVVAAAVGTEVVAVDSAAAAAEAVIQTPVQPMLRIRRDISQEMAL
jgi:hypothetical protein